MRVNFFIFKLFLKEGPRLSGFIIINIIIIIIISVKPLKS